MQSLLEQCCISTLPTNKTIPASMHKVGGKWLVVSPDDCMDNPAAYHPLQIAVHTRNMRTYYIGAFNVLTSRGKQQYKFRGNCKEGDTFVTIVVERVV